MNADKVRARLAELRAVEAAGTPGPWRTGYLQRCCKMDHGPGVFHGRGVCNYEPDGWRVEPDHFGCYVSTVDGTVVVGSNDYGAMLSRQDAQSVAESRSALPALLAVAEAALAALSAYDHLAVIRRPPELEQMDALRDALEALGQ